MRNISGLKAKRNGQQFEQRLDNYFNIFKNLGFCNIEKTPEPFKFIKPYNNNLFVGCFVKQAQPDYKGTLKGGQAIVLEAKSTSTGRIQKSALTENELKELGIHYNLGALSGVLVYDQQTDNIYLFPYLLFEKMEVLRNRKSLDLKKETKYNITKNLVFDKDLIFIKRILTETQL